MTGALDSDIHKYKPRDTQAQLCALNQTLQYFNPHDLHKPIGCWEGWERMHMVSPIQPVFTVNSALVLFFIGTKPILSRNPQYSGVSWSRGTKIHDTRYQILRVMAGQKILLRGKMIWESRLSDYGLKNVGFETVCTLTLLLGKIGTGFSTEVILFLKNNIFTLDISIWSLISHGWKFLFQNFNPVLLTE